VTAPTDADLDRLVEIATAMAEDKARKSWGAPIVLDDVFVQTLADLDAAGSKVKAAGGFGVARLWARWTPRSSALRLFELRAGITPTGDRLWSAVRYVEGWSQGPFWVRPDEDLGARYLRRYELHVRARDLGADHVGRLVANPIEELRRGGIESRRCFHCGRELTDPQSMHRAVGPECLRRHEKFMRWLEQRAA
jgi:hypothetical protein